MNEYHSLNARVPVNYYDLLYQLAAQIKNIAAKNVKSLHSSLYIM